MAICNWARHILIATCLLVFLAGTASAEQTRVGKIVTIEGQEISFFKLDDRPLIKGWLNGTALEIPVDTVSEIVLFDTPRVNYSILGNQISSGEMELSRRMDGKKFIVEDAFLPSDCDCTHLTYTYRNPFTEEFIKGNIDISGIKKIIFEE